VVRRRRDLAVLVLLDVSGSANDPSPAGGTIHDQQRTAALALVTALQGLGDRVALYGFRSQGRSAIQVLPVKRFNQPVQLETRRRLGSCRAGAYTRLGAAIRHATSVIEREAGTTRRLLVLLSDGLAYDHGYEGHYGEADARRALAEARRGGTGCVCVSIGAATDVDTMRRVFGTAAHAGLGRSDQLADVVAPIFTLALRSAEAQRRIFARTHRSAERLDLQRGIR
jgi:nitric oxide reductase activation protein